VKLASLLSFRYLAPSRGEVEVTVLREVDVNIEAWSYTNSFYVCIEDAMKNKRCCFPLWLISVSFLIVSVFSAWAGGIQRCMVCGMDVSKYPHTRYMVETTDGKKHTTCGVQCGLTLHLRLKDKWKSAKAADLLSNRIFDVKEGFYVYKSSVITDMAPGFIAFKVRVDAEKFAKGFGGQVVTYEEALEIWRKRMK
jgi:hypothetical protein